MQGRKLLLWSVGIVAGLYFLFRGLSLAKGFLVPISFAVLLSLLLYPVVVRLEKWGVKRGLASFLGVLLIVALLAGIISLVGTQISNFAENWQKIEQDFWSYVDKVQQYINEKTGISPSKQEQEVRNKLPSLLSNVGSMAKKVVSSMFSLLLTLVYTFFFLYLRKRFKLFVLKLVPSGKNEKAKTVIGDAGKSAGGYLFGKMMLIFSLMFFYSSGFLIIGIPNAILIGIIAAVFSIIPYIGNIIGGTLALGMALISGGGLGEALGVIATFTVAQFVESYILEPMIMSYKVSLNPVFTIMTVVLGGAIWNVPGMILAIPYLAITKVVFDNVEPLKPFGYLIGKEQSTETMDKILNWLKQKLHVEQIAEKVKGIFSRKRGK